MDELLEALQEKLQEAAGGAPPDPINRKADMIKDQWESMHQECLDSRKAAQAQEAEDRRIALEEQKKELQLAGGLSDKRLRDELLDRQGDINMEISVRGGSG